MRPVFNGLRAGVFSALLLTFWSLVDVSSAMSAGATSTGMAFVATAFGLIGLPQVLYGLGLGLVIALWSRALTAGEGGGSRWIAVEADRRLAAWLLSAPLGIGLVAVGVGVVHLAVTSKFIRPGFQAMGLVLVTATLLAAVVAVAPLVFEVIDRLLSRVPLKEKTSAPLPRLSTAIVGLYGLGALVIVVAGYRYAGSLNIWSPTLLNMGLGALLITPMLTGLMSRWSPDRVAWRFGLPIAGAIAALICFVGASDWALSTQEMRQATLRDAPLVAATARVVINPTGDGPDTAFAFDDCDDEDPDADCAVPDRPTIALTSLDHPARRSVSLALEAGHQASVNKFEDIPDPPKNIVMILVDTVRQDHLGYAGYERNTSPHIDAIAGDGVAFMDTYATSPHTPRSIPPLFFSRYASRMLWAGAQYNYPRVRPENLGLFEVLEERGYHNYGMTSHFYFEERRGVGQGFQTWDNEGALTIAESNDDIAAPRIWAKVEPLIEELGREKADKGDEARPFSLFIHLFEPHARWIGHSEFDFGRGETTHERHINNYDSEIAFADSYVGRVVDKLKEAGLYDEVIFIVTSDHGEAFNEHGYYFHGQNLYNEVIKIPLVIRVPGWFSRRVEGPVSLIDVAPTLLDLLGVAIPTEFEGLSQADVMLGRRAPALRPVFSELLPYTSWKEHHRAVIHGEEKYIVNFTLGIEEFYDLASDPGEQNNLISSEPERAKNLRKMLDEFME
ncbi:MAG: sulfatase [Bradymonadaceae bacterium]